jgi:hypothetical protein
MRWRRRETRLYVQYHTNVTYRTCADCLALHGRIARDPAAFPDPADGCERKLLPFPRRELKERKERGRRMQALARDELRRRELMARAAADLAESPEGAIQAFRNAVAIDLFLPELEALAEEHAEILAGDPELRRKLWDLFTRAYSAKFGWRRYEQRMPEPVRIAREQAGLRRLDALFG